MANPIKTSDLFQDTGEFKKLIAELELVRDELEALRKQEIENAKKLSETLKTSTTSTRKQRKELEESAKQAAEIEKRYNKYNASLGENAQKIAALKLAQQQINNVNKLTAKLNAAAEGSYNQLSAQYSLNKIRLNQLSKEQRSNTAEGKKLEKQTKAIYEEMKVMQEATGKTSLNVGNYKESVKEALSELDQMPGALGRFSSGLKGVEKQAKALLRNPLLLFLSAVAGTLIALGNAFLKTEKGAKILTKATGILNGFMSQMVSVSSNVATGVTAAFENPQQAVKDLGNFILNNVLNRFKAIPLIAKAAMNATTALFERDMSKLKAAGEDAFFAINQAVTGLDENQVKDVAGAVVELTKEVVKEADAFARLEDTKIRVTKANRELIKSIENLTTVEAKNNAISDDTTKSFKERETAAEAARKALEARAKKEIQLAKNNLSVINTEIDLRKANNEKVSALLDEQLSAYQALRGAEREYTLAVLDNERTRSELKQDRLERDLDILIDAFDNQKTINERLLKDDKITLEERAKLFQQTANEANESFAKQIETIQEFTGVAVNSNELINESNAVVLNQKIRSLGLSEIIEGRLLEIIRDRRTATIDLIEAEQDLIDERNKANRVSDISILPDIARDSTSEQKIIQNAKDFLDEAKAELEADNNEPKSIYDFLGIDLSDKQEASANSAFAFAKQQLLDLANTRAQLAQQNVAQSNSEVQAAQTALQTEVAKSEAGLASNIEAREKDLADAKKNQQAALKEQEKAQKAQLAIQSIQQASSLVTAAAKIFSDFKFPLALPIIGLMFGAFAAAKIKAFQATKQQFGEGGYEVIGGGTHASGNDTPLGFSVGGRPAYGEKGEAHAIISRRMTSKYKNILPSVVESFRKGNFEEKYGLIAQMQSDAGANTSAAINVNNDNRGVEERIDKMIAQNQRTYYKNTQGQLVEQYKNVTRIYV